MLNASHPSVSSHNVPHSALLKVSPLVAYCMFVWSTMLKYGPRNRDKRHSFCAVVSVVVAVVVGVEVAVDVADVVRLHPLHVTGQST